MVLCIMLLCLLVVVRISHPLSIDPLGIFNAIFVAHLTGTRPINGCNTQFSVQMGIVAFGNKT